MSSVTYTYVIYLNTTQLLVLHIWFMQPFMMWTVCTHQVGLQSFRSGYDAGGRGSQR